MSEENFEIGDSAILGPEYFDKTYKVSAVWLGLLWWLTAMVPYIAYQVSLFRFTWGLTSGEAHAWGVA